MKIKEQLNEVLEATRFEENALEATGALMKRMATLTVMVSLVVFLILAGPANNSTSVQASFLTAITLILLWSVGFAIFTMHRFVADVCQSVRDTGWYIPMFIFSMVFALTVVFGVPTFGAIKVVAKFPF